MRSHVVVGSIVSAALLTGCATSLSSPQKLEYEAMKNNGLLVTEKSPAAAAMLGLLPGGGSYYVGDTSTAVKNFYLWPLSVLWDPVSGYQGAKAVNYKASLREIRNNRDQETAVLNDKLRAGQITHSEYQAERDKLDAKYQY
jgi:hypothetical protein